MNIRNYKIFLFAFIFISGHLIFFPGSSFSDEVPPIAIVVSKRIKPYVSIIEGMTEELGKKEKKFEIFFLPESDPPDNQQITTQLENSGFDLYAAVGPEAAKLVWSLKTDQSKVFTAVLDPEVLLETGSSQCGVSLRIPVERQVQEISNAFVNIKRIGLLFDARINDWFYKAAETASRQYNISIIPLRVESRAQITEVLAQNWQNLDCVWMIPDQTVISEKIIEHIIKLALYNSKGVIGYNSFFIRTGAFFSFDFDYKILGAQAARKIETYVQSGVCVQESPEFQTLMNLKMIEKIGIKIRE
jgi:putative ABC transport system substrate-binding protein